MYIDNYKPETFLWILEKFDVPYVESIWFERANIEYLKDPSKFGPMSVLGKYMRTMNMAQYADYGFKDSERVNREIELEKKPVIDISVDEEYERELKRKFENGEISEAEYKTFSRLQEPEPEPDIRTKPETEEQQEVEEPQDSVPEESTFEPKPLTPPPGLDFTENTIEDELSKDDIKYLALKWGISYKPSEWVKMEELYQKYASEYELNVDREDTLKKICKISLKMDYCLDTEDFQGFQKLSQTFDALRKSAKFTEAQNKEEEVRELDSIGELVNFVEKEGGIIPEKDNPIEYPQDKIDFIIRDMQNYVDTLVKNELGLGDLIETYIERLDKQKVENVDDIINNSFRKTEEEDSVTEEEARDFQDFLLNEIEQESQRLAEGDLS